MFSCIKTLSTKYNSTSSLGSSKNYNLSPFINSFIKSNRYNKKRTKKYKTLKKGKKQKTRRNNIN